MAIRFSSNVDDLQRKIRQATIEALEVCGVKGVAECRANCKVKTGTLRRGHSYDGIYRGERFTMTIGNTVDYSIYVEFKPVSRGGRPWFRKSLQGLEQEFIREFTRLMR